MCYFNSCPYLLIDSDKATKGLLCGPREGLPTPVFWPGKSMDYSPRGCKESDTTEWISLLLSCGPRSHIWESCKLENSTNYYEWTTFPKSFNMFFEIAPQFIHIVISRCRYYFWVSIRSSFFQQPNTCLNGTTHYFPPPQVYMHTQSLQSCPTLWIIAYQAPLSMGFSRQENWTGLPCPPPGDLPDLGIESASPALQTDSLLLSHWGSPPPPCQENSGTADSNVIPYSFFSQY